MNIKTKYDRHQRVYIKPFNMNGTVESIKFSGKIKSILIKWRRKIHKSELDKFRLEEEI